MSADESRYPKGLEGLTAPLNDGGVTAWCSTAIGLPYNDGAFDMLMSGLIQSIDVVIRVLLCELVFGIRASRSDDEQLVGLDLPQPKLRICSRSGSVVRTTSTTARFSAFAHYAHRRAWSSNCGDRTSVNASTALSDTPTRSPAWPIPHIGADPLIVVMSTTR